MIIKEADDKARDIETLQALAARPDANAETRKRIEQEIRNIQAGVRGEQEAAYEMKVHYGESRNWALIHDLRIEHGGLFAQIDHLVVNRWLDMWVCESKHFSEGVKINESGEFMSFFGGKSYGVPSPIEQNAKHILILQRLFDAGGVDLPKRLGFTIKPELKGLVLVSKKAKILRPDTQAAGLECVIKNDQFFKTVDKAVDENGLLSMGKLIGSDTLEDIARRIAALHLPASFDWAAKFGLPATVAAPAPKPAAPVPQVAKPKPAIAAAAPATRPEPTPDAVQAMEDGKPKSKLACHSCGEQVAYNVAKFCWFNKAKFGGKVFCMDCQKKV